MKPLSHIERPNVEDYSGPAKIAPRITTEGRTFLPDVIPLSTPYLVFLDPSDLCNAKCGWCPTGSGEIKKYRKQQLMEWDVYTKAINDLADMPEKIKVLRLYMMGESLLNPRIAEMIQYAADTTRFEQIDLTTNGLLLTKQMSDGLIDAGLNKIFISVPADYAPVYSGNIAYLFGYSRHTGCQLHLKFIRGGAGEERFFSTFERFADSISIENKVNCWPDFEVAEASDRGIYGQELPAKAVDVCPYLFYSVAINPDGKVSACFLDYQKDLILGDLKEESFKDIWNGTKFLGLRLAHLMGYRCQLKHCNNCQQLLYGAPDNIDPYADEILKKLTEG